MNDISTIYQQMRDTFREQSGFAASDSCDGAVRLYALAAQIQALSIQADWVLMQCFPQTAQDIYLDHHAQMRGITRNAALHADGFLRFYAAAEVTTPLTIAADTVCMTADGATYKTTEPATIAGGQIFADAPAVAITAGSAGNAAADTISVFSKLPVGIVRCTNPEPFSGGADAENDDSLRARILESYQRLPNGANAAFYEQEALRFPEVASAVAVGRARGIGTVDVYISAQEGMPSEELLAKVYDSINRKREIAVDLRVLAAVPKEVSVAAKIAVAPGYSFDEVSVAAEAAIRNCFTGKELGRDVLIARLYNALYNVEGLTNYHLLAPTADTAVDQTELPTLAAISLTEIASAETEMDNDTL